MRASEAPPAVAVRDERAPLGDRAREKEQSACSISGGGGDGARGTLISELAVWVHAKSLL